MKKVNVLLSTYNGEKHIRRQLDSLVNQNYKNFKLYVRDDGSRDQTVDIVRSYSEQIDLEIIEGENLGFVKSFFQLLQYAEEGDYWAFCDQDDWWKEEKIACAVDWLQSQMQDIPLLYHSAYEVVEADSEEREVFYFKEEGYDLRRSITENHISGFSMVINDVMRKKMLQGDPDQIDYHDWWAAMIITAFGSYRSDDRVLAKYYRYNDSVTKITIKHKIDWFIKNFSEKSAIQKRVKTFHNAFHGELSREQSRTIDLFLTERYSLKKAFMKCFYPRRWRPNWSSEIAMRLMMLLGKI